MVARRELQQDELIVGQEAPLPRRRSAAPNTGQAPAGSSTSSGDASSAAPVTPSTGTTAASSGHSNADVTDRANVGSRTAVNTPGHSSAPAGGDAKAADAWTVRRVLEWTIGHLQKHGSDSPRLDAEILLAHARQCKRIQLYTDYDQVLSEPVRAAMRALVQRRAQHEPVAYLVGHREFFSLEMQVNSAVLIPRPDSETLVVEALALLAGVASPRVLDLCTGSGCLAIAVAKNQPLAHVTATDVSSEALAVAAKNVERHQLADRVQLLPGNLWQAIPEGAPPFDVIVSNPPYITSAELGTLQADVARYEPRLALDGGSDGLDFLQPILLGAPARLRPHGGLLVEFSPEQAERLVAIAEATGQYDQVTVLKDLSGAARVLKCRRAD
jgi:release factor glutamine methyltransferase